ncbi:MAG: flavodoxin-dependent (E)-4-hydroxy-3-methylbut-2-enyl-diphosphate synthase, partial [Candidatus Kapabacteria bacterium]|nr:flavodoxin-dependent (E)-4-hydroxy-3-methylbut-2-enyl-diphosphate synthase [Candidatus Kapabacteria bacterium]
MRKNTKQVMVGNVAVGGGAPIAVQTMTKTKTWDAEATIAQIKRCKIAGADIVRSTVNDEKSADAMKEIVSECRNIPIVADIHFNHIFALKAIEAGVAKVRINPGNIGSEDRVREVLDAAKNKNIPIRIGVNSGSLDPELLAKYGHPTAEALYASAMKHVEIANKCGF